MDFSTFEVKTIEAIDDCRGAVRNCGKNAVHHLEKAWAIRDLDLEMAIFRGITAEEEAATSLFYCLKNHNYLNSRKISFKEHKYKLGLYPFLHSIGKFLGRFHLQASSPFDKFSVRHVEKNVRKAIELVLNMPAQRLSARPTPPLNFTIKDSGTDKVYTFRDEFNDLVNGHGYDKALKYLKDIANTRNEILYANCSGRPQVSGDIGGYLIEQKKKVMLALAIVLMIDPWEKKDGGSLFVQQALDSFLLLLDKISPEDFYQPNQ